MNYAYLYPRNDIKPCRQLFPPSTHFSPTFDQQTCVNLNKCMLNVYAHIMLAFGDNLILIPNHLWNIMLVSSNPSSWSTKMIIKAHIASVPSGLYLVS